MRIKKLLVRTVFGQFSIFPTEFFNFFIRNFVKYELIWINIQRKSIEWHSWMFLRNFFDCRRFHLRFLRSMLFVRILTIFRIILSFEFKVRNVSFFENHFLDIHSIFWRNLVLFGSVNIEKSASIVYKISRKTLRTSKFPPFIDDLRQEILKAEIGNFEKWS